MWGQGSDDNKGESYAEEIQKKTSNTRQWMCTASSGPAGKRTEWVKAC